jgi:hypothetical protein
MSLCPQQPIPPVPDGTAGHAGGEERYGSP